MHLKSGFKKVVEDLYWYINRSFTTEPTSWHIGVYLHPLKVELVQNLVSFIQK